MVSCSEAALSAASADPVDVSDTHLLNLALHLAGLFAMLQSPRLRVEFLLLFPHVERLFAQFPGDRQKVFLHHVRRGVDDDWLCSRCTDQVHFQLNNGRLSARLAELVV